MRSTTTQRHRSTVAARRKDMLSAAFGFPVTRDRLLAAAGPGEWIRRIASSTAPPATLLVRAFVGAVFLVEGVLKFHDPEGLGVGRFAKIGIPFPSFFAPFDGVFEIVCGMGLMLGLLTRLGAIPMIVNMLVAITSTKIPLLFHEGFWKAAHEARLDVSMLLGCAFLLLVGAGPLSLDSRLLAPPHRGSDPVGPGEDGREWGL